MLPLLRDGNGQGQMFMYIHCWFKVLQHPWGYLMHLEWSKLFAVLVYHLLRRWETIFVQMFMSIFVCGHLHSWNIQQCAIDFLNSCTMFEGAIWKSSEVSQLYGSSCSCTTPARYSGMEVCRYFCGLDSIGQGI